MQTAMWFSSNNKKYKICFLQFTSAYPINLKNEKRLRSVWNQRREEKKPQTGQADKMAEGFQRPKNCKQESAPQQIFMSRFLLQKQGRGTMHGYNSPDFLYPLLFYVFFNKRVWKLGTYMESARLQHVLTDSERKAKLAMYSILTS